MSGLFSRGSAVLPVTGVDLSSKEGYLVKSTAGVHAVNDSATSPAMGVVLEGNAAAKDSSIGILGGIGPVRMKTSGAIAKFATVQQASDGTIVTDAGTGTRVVVGTALEAGASGDLIEVQTYAPQVRS